MIRRSNRTSAIKKQLARIERHIRINRSLGFGTKKLRDARSDCIRLLKQRNAY
ncbi:MAG: hypothetical protein GJ680_18070 [Alteromonadaceae bacterium]|nr:hypothetical protein [Alteromonadaceae bacterium]